MRLLVVVVVLVVAATVVAIIVVVIIVIVVFLKIFIQHRTKTTNRPNNFKNYDVRNCFITGTNISNTDDHYKQNVKKISANKII